MNVEIFIQLTDDDTAGGMTIHDALSKLIGVKPASVVELTDRQRTDRLIDEEGELPAHLVQELHDREARLYPPAPALAEGPGLGDEGAGATEPAPLVIDPTDTNLDSSGVPWNSEIHNGNHKKYTDGAEKDRWMWRRGSNVKTRETTAMKLAAQYRASVVAATPVPAPAPAVASAVIMPPGAAVAAPAVIMPPGTAATRTAMPATEWKFPAFIAQMTARQISATQVLAVTSIDGVATIPELAINPQAMAKAAVALGFAQ